MIDYYLDCDPKPVGPDTYSFYSGRLQNCDIVIALLFNKGGSICESEITLATETGKNTIILTTPDPRYLPKIHYQGDPEIPHVRVFNYFDSPEDAVKKLSNDTRFFSNEIADFKESIQEKKIKA